MVRQRLSGTTWGRGRAPQRSQGVVCFPSEGNLKQLLGKANLFFIMLRIKFRPQKEACALSSWILEFGNGSVWNRSMGQGVCAYWKGRVAFHSDGRRIGFNNNGLLANTGKSTLSWCYISSAVIQHQSNLKKKAFTWAYGSRERRVKHGRKLASGTRHGSGTS